MDCLCRRGATVQNSAHGAFLQAGENSAPSKSGIKHLGQPVVPREWLLVPLFVNNETDHEPERRDHCWLHLRSQGRKIGSELGQQLRLGVELGVSVKLSLFL